MKPKKFAFALIENLEQIIYIKNIGKCKAAKFYGNKIVALFSCIENKFKHLATNFNADLFALLYKRSKFTDKTE